MHDLFLFSCLSGGIIDGSVLEGLEIRMKRQIVCAHLLLKVTLGANQNPTINDITASELKAVLEDATEMDEVLR